ncbi:MAG TPA: tetratricopeptide repeat protein [Rhodanobacteraceae bacterium]|jgi:DNA-binding winged helix-turn-helix (wHTH) protein/tetratricopeptide (TPR) repeat protein|nr:tetratricopeptide repeat protein [Rhodanobacteraceae bacterium]
MSALQKPIYRFGEFELDPDERRLLAHGAAVTLTPKVFDTLVLLVERAGHAISKDELMRALWPRGFVDESNLTKHIWLIRKALGVGENDTRWIETVPKLGYRFVAPVQRIAREEALPVTVGDADAEASAHRVSPLTPERKSVSDAKSADDAPIAEREMARQHVPATLSSLPVSRRWIGAAGTAIVIALAVVWFVIRDHSANVATTADARGSAVAIVEFSNLSQNAKDSWLGPALGEMLATEITAGGRMYALPDELVRPARADLAAPLAGGYAAQSLATLRRRLGADYVLSGGYVVAGSSDQPRVRLDLALQDARTGATVANLARDAALSDLPALVAEAGSGLREHLGVEATSRGALQQVANAQPPTADVARRIGFALDALHRDDPARARDELLDAIAQAPGYAPAYSYLAQAWSALGYGVKAAAAADQAAAHAAGLPEEQRLQIELQQQATQRAWDKAAATARALVSLRPENPDYRLRLIQLLLSAHEDAGADAALGDLRKLVDAAKDPRIELAAADIASARDDTKGAAVHARQALALAEARDEAGQIAAAQAQLGAALGYLGDSNAQIQLRKAIATYQQNGNPAGEASARESLGKSLAGSGQGDAAREEYQRAMAIYQGIGDLGGTTTVYSDLARMLWSAGDRDAASTAARHVVELARETGDLRMQAWGLQALTTADSDESASDAVIQGFRDVLALDEKTANKGGTVWALANYADVLRLRGDLSAAEEACKRAMSAVKDISDPQFTLLITFNCAQIALDRGDLALAEDGLDKVMALAKSVEDSLQQANVELTLAQIAIGRRRFADARPRLERAAQISEKAEAHTGTANAEALLALCADALGDTSARDGAVARARELRRGITERQEVFAVDIALALIRAHAGDAGAVGDLRALAEDADRRQWLGWSLESRLAALDALRLQHDPAAAALSAEIAKTAHEHGFGWVLTRLGDGSSDAVASQH